MGDLRTIGKGAAYVFAGLVFAKLVAYVWRIIVAKTGPESYGLLSLAISILGLTYTFSFLGLESAVMRYMAYFQEKNDNSKMKGVIFSSLKLSIPVSVLVSIALYTYSDFISINLFEKPTLSPLLKIVSFGIVPYMVYIMSLSALIGLKKIEGVVISRNITESTIRLIATIVLIYLGYGILGAAAAYILAFVFSAIVSLYFLEKNFPFLRTKISAEGLEKELLNYSLPLLMGGVVVQMLSWVDILMIGYFRTASEVGIYSTAVPTAALLLFIPSSLSTLFLPVITAAYAKNRTEDIKRVYLRVTKLTVVANLPIVLIMMFFSQDILGFFFGGVYSKGALPLTILALGYFVSSAVTASNAILNMTKNTKSLMAVAIISTAVNVALNCFLIPLYGINGAAVSASIAMTLSGILVCLSAYKSINIVPYDKSLFYVCLLGGGSLSGMYFGLHAIYSTIPIIPAIIGVLLFFAFYLYLIFKFRIIEKNEVVEIINTFKGKIRTITSPAMWD